jgi:pimeloyl-ACP methyl ester carboxylesterase
LNTVLVVTAVFVHGNPETAAVWSPLLAELGRADVLTLSPPGFGAPVPDGFGATADEYVAWLATELEAIGEPVDLVGHDWGANHALRLACQRPDLLRSWCTDTAGSFAQDYVWHEATHAWQTPGEGEKAIANLLAMGVPGRATLYESLGMTPPVAKELAEGFDETMGRCILALYRSAAQRVLAQWSERLPAASARPGLVLIPTEDIYTGGEARHRWVAERTGARIAVLEGLGHWWLLQDPKVGADALRRFWATR